MIKNRFGAFDATNPNGIIAIGDKKAIFGLRILTYDRETKELISERELNLPAIHVSTIKSDCVYKVCWEVNGKKVSFLWTVTGAMELFAECKFAKELLVAVELYVPWKKRLDREWFNYTKQSNRVFTGEYITPFEKCKYNAIRLIMERKPDSDAGYNLKEQEYAFFSEHQRFENIAPGQIWSDMGIWWNYGLSFESSFRFLLQLGQAEKFFDLPEEKELDKLLAQAEKKAVAVLNKEKTDGMNGTGIFTSACEVLSSALYYNTVYNYQFKKRYIITDRTWTRNDKDWGIIYNWDTFLSSFASCWFDGTLAKENMLCAFETQLPDGRIPLHTRAVDDATEPPITAGRCQHIVQGLTMWQVYLHTKDKKWLKTCYDKAKRVHEWWFAARKDGQPYRDPLNIGLLTFGYDAEMEMGILGKKTQPYAGKAQYAYFETYDDSPQWTTGDFFKSTEGLEGAKEQDFRDEARYNETTHTATIYTLERTCLYALECLCLEQAAMELGYHEEAGMHREKYETIKKAVNERMWDSETGCYYNMRFDGSLSRIQTPDCFMPIMAGIADEKKAEALLSILTDENKFWGACMPPSVAKDHPAFSQQKYWRGAVWPPMVLWTYFSLKKAGTPKQRWEYAVNAADILAREWEENGNYPENYDCRTGRNSGAEHYNWGVLMVIPLLEEMVDVQNDRIIFGNELAPEGSGINNIPLDGHRYSVKVSSEGTEVYCDGVQIACQAGNVIVWREELKN